MEPTPRTLKYVIPFIVGESAVSLPRDCRVLSVGWQSVDNDGVELPYADDAVHETHQGLRVWVLCSHDWSSGEPPPMADRTFVVVPTGSPIMSYVPSVFHGTVQNGRGDVMHVFEAMPGDRPRRAR